MEVVQVLLQNGADATQMDKVGSSGSYHNLIKKLSFTTKSDKFASPVIQVLKKQKIF